MMINMRNNYGVVFGIAWIGFIFFFGIFCVFRLIGVKNVTAAQPKKMLTSNDIEDLKDIQEEINFILTDNRDIINFYSDTTRTLVTGKDKSVLKVKYKVSQTLLNEMHSRLKVNADSLEAKAKRLKLIIP